MVFALAVFAARARATPLCVLRVEPGKQFHCSYSGVDEQISREMTDLSPDDVINGSPVTF